MSIKDTKLMIPMQTLSSNQIHTHPGYTKMTILMAIRAFPWPGTQVFGQYSHLNVNKRHKIDDSNANFVPKHQIDTHAIIKMSILMVIRAFPFPILCIFYTFWASLSSLKVMNCIFTKVAWATWHIYANLTEIYMFLRSWPAIWPQFYAFL